MSKLEQEFEAMYRYRERMPDDFRFERKENEYLCPDAQKAFEYWCGGITSYIEDKWREGLTHD